MKPATLLLPFALLLAAMSEPDCRMTSAYCVQLGSIWSSDEPLVTILRRDGAVLQRLAATDIFTPNDAQSLNHRHFSFVPFYRGETMIVPVPTRMKDPNAPVEEIRIDLATGKVSRPDHDIFPAPRVWAIAVAADQPTPPSSETPPCLSRDVERLSSAEMLARAIEQPMPEYPFIALKARVAGTTRVEVVVGEDGRVLCSRLSKPIAFGIGEVTEKAARRWTFQPAPRKFVGEIEFHFDRVPWDFKP